MYLREDWNVASSEWTLRRRRLNEDNLVVFLWSHENLFFLHLSILRLFWGFVDVEVLCDLWFALSDDGLDYGVSAGWPSEVNDL